MMSQIEVDEDIIHLLKKMKSEDESISDVLRKVLSNIDPDTISNKDVTPEEFEQASEKILDKYQDLLVKLAE